MLTLSGPHVYTHEYRRIDAPLVLSDESVFDWNMLQNMMKDQGPSLDDTIYIRPVVTWDLSQRMPSPVL